MEWSDLRIFLAIAREGTLGAAARRLGQTQPTMGRRLRSLEGAVGSILFHRTAEGFVPTDQGKTLLAHAERVESEVLAFQRQLADQDSQIEAMLRLTSPGWFGIHILAPVLAEFSARHPKVCVELLTDGRLYSLPRREADIAFRLRPFEEPEVISRRLLQMPYALYGPAGTAPPIAGDGANARLIVTHTAAQDQPDAIWLRRVLPQADVILRSNDRDVQARLCAAGAGLAVLPCSLGDATPGLVSLDIGESPPARDIYVGYHPDLRRLAYVRALLDLIVTGLAHRRGDKRH